MKNLNLIFNQKTRKFLVRSTDTDRSGFVTCIIGGVKQYLTFKNSVYQLRFENGHKTNFNDSEKELINKCNNDFTFLSKLKKHFGNKEFSFK
jgi:hypothetical protein